MTAPGERFKSWIDSLSIAWSDRLGLWAGHFIAKGIEKTLDDMEPELVAQGRAFMEKIRDTPDLPLETKALFDAMLAPKSFSWVPSLIAFIVSLITSIVASMGKGAMEPAFQQAQKATPFHIPDLGMLLDMKLRGKITKEEYPDLVGKLGWSVPWADKFLAMKTPILPSDLAFPAWLRDKDKYQSFVDDLPKLGLSPDIITLLKELAYRVPGAQDVIRYMVKEVYSPEVYKPFGQDEEFPGELPKLKGDALSDAEATGVRPEHLLKEWIAHWNLPGSGQGFEMLHRTTREPTKFSGKPVGKDSEGAYYSVIDDSYLDKLLKALDIMPAWRDMLKKISWSAPNRVELRMLARYGLVDKPFLIRALRDAGLTEDYRDTIADMMLAQGLMTDLPIRYRNKWINSVEVKAELKQAGLSPDIQERIYKWIVKNAGPERTVAEKDLTAAEIIKGVKKGYLTWGEAVQQLMELGYDEVEADYKLAIDVEVVETIPTTELNTRVDTIRRRRRARFISRDEEISSFLGLGIDVGLATAYADNDDLRLVKATTEET